MSETLYSIGHSNHSTAYFGELLNAFSITCVVDVRSVAASTYNPHFNKEPLSIFLKSRGIIYMHFATEFGARHTNLSLLDADGRVSFAKVQQSDAFQRGVERLRMGLERSFRIALMCSEADPFDCHRYAMISSYLVRQGFIVQHILKDKTVISNAELDDELLIKYRKKIPQPSLFEPHVSRSIQLEIAYQLRNQDIGWSPQQPESTEPHD